MTATRWRKKPVEIEAVKFTLDDDAPRWPDWLEHAAKGGAVRHTSIGTLLIETLEGIMVASQGDWIIRGVKGELYPCKPDIFMATYLPIKDDKANNI